jgi:hypothetical protein
MRTILQIRAVGGQSLPLVVELLARKAAQLDARFYARQTLGMAQRHGVVRATVELESGDDDGLQVILLGLERLEGLRGFSTLSPGDRAFISTAALVPPGTRRNQQPPYPSLDDLRWAAEHYEVELELVDAPANKPWKVIQAAIDAGLIFIPTTHEQEPS